MEDILKKEIIELVDKAYEQIDNSLYYNSYKNIERGVSIGLDDLLEIKRIIERKEKMNTIKDITFLETIETDITHEEALTKYWGKNAWSNMFGDDENIENSLMYAVYNDEIADNLQLGTITEIYDKNANLIDIKIYRDLM